MAGKLGCVPFKGMPARVPTGFEMHVHPHIVEYCGEQFVRTFHGSACGKPLYEATTSPMAIYRGVPRGKRIR